MYKKPAPAAGRGHNPPKESTFWREMTSLFIGTCVRCLFVRQLLVDNIVIYFPHSSKWHINNQIVSQLNQGPNNLITCFAAPIFERIFFEKKFRGFEDKNMRIFQYWDVLTEILVEVSVEIQRFCKSWEVFWDYPSINTKRNFSLKIFHNNVFELINPKK